MYSMLRSQASSRQGMSRPQSAFTNAEPDIMNKTVTGSEFPGSQSEFEEVGEDTDTVVQQIGSQTEERGQVLDRLNITNILELSKQQT